MSEDEIFAINENVFEKIRLLKKKMGFSDKEWNEWFSHLCDLYENDKNELEQIMEKLYYKTTYDDWVKNFALNLSYIWEESSATELNAQDNTNQKNSAIIIGWGPSLKKKKHLESLSKSNFNGTIICTDASLKGVLKAGITPIKFPKFFVVTIDPKEEIHGLYDDPIIDEFGSQINGIFSTVVHPKTLDYARKAGIKIHWLHALLDYQEGEKSFNQTSALMVRAKKHTDGLPAIQTGGNVGTSSWFISWKILNCNTIALVGFDHGWTEDDPIDKIMSHGYTCNPIQIDKKSKLFQKLFPKIYNPEFNVYFILDPVYQYYSNAFKEFIKKSPENVSTINATEGGSIFGDRINCMTFEQFLNSNNAVT